MIDKILSFVIRRWLLLTITFVILIGLWMVSTFSILTIEVTNPKDGTEMSFKLASQDSGKDILSFISNEKAVTKVIRKSALEITVSQQGSSAFGVITTKGFFQKSEISMSLVTTPGKEYIGNEPGVCISYFDNILYSYGCKGATSVTIHKPATNSQPTYNTKKDLDIGIVGDFVSTKVGFIAIAQFEEEDGAQKHVLYLLDGQLNITKQATANDLDVSKQYKIKSYKDGFLVYDTEFSGAKYFSAIGAKPENISLPKSNIRPNKLETYGNSIMLTIPSAEASKQSDNNNSSSGLTIGSVIVISQGQTKQYDLSMKYANISFCGKKTLCGVQKSQDKYSDKESGKLDVYSIGDKLELLYSINDVVGIHSFSEKLGVIRLNNILSLDPLSGTGAIIYSSVGSRICDLQSSGDDFLICVSGPSGRSFMLRLDSKKVDDQIDQKIDTLYKYGGVNMVSVYKNIIFISGNFGDLVYDDALGSFGYDQTIKSATVKAINSMIDELGLSKNYFIKINQ